MNIMSWRLYFDLAAPISRVPGVLMVILAGWATLSNSLVENPVVIFPLKGNMIRTPLLN